MAQSVMQRIQSLSEEQEKLMNEESDHGGSHVPGIHSRLREIQHELDVLWDLRRRELAGEEVNLDEDFLDRYDRYN